VNSSELRTIIAPNIKKGEKRVSMTQIFACKQFKQIVDDIVARSKSGEPVLTDLERDVELVVKRKELFESIATSEGYYQKNIDDYTGLAIIPHQNDPQGRWMPMKALLDLMKEADTDTKHGANYQ